MTHDDLHATLRDLGWTEDRRGSGVVFFYAPEGIVDRAIQTIPEDPTHALAIIRGAGRSCTSIDEAAAWAREAS